MPPCTAPAGTSSASTHGKGVGELFDLKNDPWEHENLWDEPAHAELKNQLLAESFDAHVLLTTDVGSRRIAPM